MRDILLSCQGLTKRFDGLAAVHDVTLDWARDEIHAVIGPNGAGKSTLSHLMAGDLPCTSGRIQLTGQDVTHWHAEKRSHLGLGRSFQKTNIFLPLTVAENIRLAAQSRHQRLPAHPMGWWSSALTDAKVLRTAQEAMEMAQLSHRQIGRAHV